MVISNSSGLRGIGGIVTADGVGIPGAPPIAVPGRDSVSPAGDETPVYWPVSIFLHIYKYNDIDITWLDWLYRSASSFTVEVIFISSLIYPNLNDLTQGSNPTFICEAIFSLLRERP